MLSIKFDNSTTGKIDGWLRNTLSDAKPDKRDASQYVPNCKHPAIKNNYQGKTEVNGVDADDSKNM